MASSSHYEEARSQLSDKNLQQAAKEAAKAKRACEERAQGGVFVVNFYASFSWLRCETGDTLGPLHGTLVSATGTTAGVGQPRLGQADVWRLHCLGFSVDAMQYRI